MPHYRALKKDWSKMGQVRVDSKLYALIVDASRAENSPIIGWVHKALCAQLGIDPESLKTSEPKKKRTTVSNGEHE